VKPGQALRWGLSFLLFVPLLAGVALGVLAWRLSSGPMESGLLARQIEHAANADGGELRLSIGRAALSWEGFRGGAGPLEVRISGARLTDAEGGLAGVLPDAAITLALAPLLRGALAPATVDLFEPALRLRREADGTLRLDLAPQPGAPAGAGEDAPSALPHLLADLMRPPEERAAHTLLRRVRILDGQVTLRDAQLDATFHLRDIQLELLRGAEGGLEADGEAILETIGASGPPMRLPVHVSGQAEGDPALISLRLDLPVLRPTELAAALPFLAPLTVMDAPLAVQARLSMDGEGRVQGLGLGLQSAEGGVLRPAPGMEIPFDALEAEALATRDLLILERAVLRLPGTAEQPLEASAELQRGPPGWTGRARLALGGFDVTAIPRLWPPALAPETREAARQAIGHGILREGSLLLDVTTAPDLTRWAVTGGRADLLLAEAEVTPPGMGPMRVTEAGISASIGPGAVTLESLHLDLASPAAGVAPTRVTGTGAARLAEGSWAAQVSLGAQAVRFADLPNLWPAGLAEGARSWITGNITEGVVTEGRWRLGLSANAALAEVRLEALDGEAAVEGATVHYLRPMPPVTGVTGRALFTRDGVTVETRGGALAPEAGGIQAADATLRFAFAPPGQPDTAEMAFNLSGPLTGLVSVLRQPRLGLFDRRPFPLNVAAGSFTGRLQLNFPLLADLRTEQMQLRAEARLANARVVSLLLERDLEGGAAELTADMQGLRGSGTGTLANVAVRFGVELDFRSGPPTQVVSRETLTARPTAAQLAAVGLDAGALLRGPVAIEARGERRRNGQSSYALTGNLRDAVLSFPPLGWEKPEGSPGQAEATLRIANDRLTSIEGIRLEALELALRARAVARGGRIERVELQETVFGASRLVGDARAGARATDPWSIALRGPLLDLRPVLGPDAPAADRAAGTEARQPPLNLDLRFDQVLIGPGREIFGVQATGRMDAAGVLRQATLRGRTARGGGTFEAMMTPGRGNLRNLRGAAEDGGAVLRALGITTSINGGRLALTGQYTEARPGAPLTGTAELENFVVRDAPALGKLLQAMTLFGLLEAMQGGNGLVFSRAVVPFTLEPDVLRVNEARAFSASLGLTARGRLLRERSILDMEGTIVPAYVFNTLLGNLPLVGRLFSPETGGGVFAATFRVQGPPEDPSIAVNPLAALTPGFLRGLFDLGGEAEAPAPR
jgi:hypothetical protein